MDAAFTQQWVPGPEENINERGEFLGMLSSDYYRCQLVEIMGDTDDRKHFGFNIRLEDLLHACPELGTQLAAEPKAALACLENWLRVAQSNVMCGPSLIEVCYFALMFHFRQN